MNTQKAFTLIELMIVVAVITILAAIAYPSYQDSLAKSRRADAKAALSELSVFMERLYTATGCYNAGADKACGTGDDVTTAPNLSLLTPFYKYNSSGAWTGAVATPKSGTVNYNLSLSVITASTYTLQAVPVSTTTDPLCGTLTLSHTGAKTPTTTGCW
jgi:type IV pilus assembly protein PilE